MINTTIHAMTDVLFFQCSFGMMGKCFAVHWTLYSSVEAFFLSKFLVSSIYKVLSFCDESGVLRGLLSKDTAIYRMHCGYMILRAVT